MANTYTSLNYHLVFSTKNREPWLNGNRFASGSGLISAASRAKTE